MSDYTLDLQNLTQETFQESLDSYNSEFDCKFALVQQSGSFALTDGDSTTLESYTSGSLREVAYFWEGYIEGASSSDSSDEESA